MSSIYLTIMFLMFLYKELNWRQKNRFRGMWTRLEIGVFYIDRFLVTNKKMFIISPCFEGYKLTVLHNILKDLLAGVKPGNGKLLIFFTAYL